ncbi:MAG TPA: fasciclin domain-containing protein [Caulobacteraceae bacterium]
MNRLLTTAAAAALIFCPAAALAQGAQATAPAAPPAAAAPSAAAPAAPAAPALPSIPKIVPGPDLYSTIKASGQFTILVKAIDATNLKGTLMGMANITMFAPTDAAFNALPPDQLAKLMTQEGLPSLQKIILYHCVGAQIDSTKIKGAKGPAQTPEGQALVLDGSNADDLLVNTADIIQTDVRTTNGGILNVVDKVLVPPDSPFAAALAATAAEPPPPAAADAAAPAAAAPAPAAH